jgi:hypothetical protein
MHKLRFLSTAIGVVLALTLLAPVGTSHRALAQDTRRIELPDFGSFSYPVATYSVMPDTFSISAEDMANVVFPGAWIISPNDSFIYEQLAQGNMVYTMRLAAITNTNNVAAENLATLLGTLPLMRYEAVGALEGATVEQTQVGGMPAVKASGVTFAEGAKATHLIILNGNTLVEIVIMPTVLYGAPNHNIFMTGNADPNLAVMESILASIQFIK